MAKFARDHLKLTQVAVLRDNKSAYSVGLTDVFSRKFSEMGGDIVANESYSKGDSDFRAQLTTIKKTKPQAPLRARVLHGRRASSPARRASWA